MKNSFPICTHERLILASLLLLWRSSVSALPISVGPNGINAKGLGLTGAGIGIGQVEPGRPGKLGFDNAGNSHPNVNPSGVFLRNGAAVANANADNHAEQVAGVMISTHGINKGVAPGASLFSSADNAAGPNFDPTSAITAQQVARQNGGDVRAINMSFGNPLVGPHTLNGNSLLTQFVDWSAREHDTLYVVAGNEGAGGIPVPTDEYNGVTVAYSQTVGGVFRQVNPGNNFTEDAVGDRRSTDLVAPGTNITMPILGGGFAAADGTSFAAPHVTGTVALLQEFGDAQIANSKPHWDTDARRHQVSKAVLMNSADKIQDTGDGKLLGMEKTILDTAGKTWLDSDAYTSKFIPLDDEMGTGQLSANRALTQFKPGEWDSFGSATVPLIGWDWGVTLGAGDVNKYIFDQPLHKDSFISVTLAWDHEVDLIDTNGNGLYDVGESFIDLGLTDLDLYLLPKGATDISQHIWASLSLVDSIEHMFFKIPEKGDYEFWVRQFNEPLGDQFYAVAWWAVPEPSSLSLLVPGIAMLIGQRRRILRIAQNA